MYTNVRNYQLLINDFNRILPMSKSTISIALIDIDFFHKNVYNNREEYIENIYKILKIHLPDIIYLGRDEFGIVQDNSRFEDILQLLGNSNNLLFQELKSHFSAGIAEYPKHGEDITELLRQLEESVYLAKEEGRYRIYIANNSRKKLKSNYYTLIQLKRLNDLSIRLDRSEASLLRESLDVLIRKYEE